MLIELECKPSVKVKFVVINWLKGVFTPNSFIDKIENLIYTKAPSINL